MSDWDDNWESPIWDDDSDRQNKRRALYAIGAFVSLVGLIVVAIVATKFNNDRHEHREVSREAIAEAFAADNVGVGQGVLDGLELFFDRLMQASRNNDELALQKLFDAERYLQRIEDCGVITSMSYLERTTLRENLSDRSFETGWGNYQIVHVDPLAESEYLAYVHLRDTNNSAMDNFRCWMARTDRGWKMFDWEVIDYGVPESVEDAMLFEYSLDPRTDEYLTSTHEIEQAYALHDQGDSDGAAAKVRSAAARNIHPVFRDDVALRCAYAWSYMGNWRECLSAAQQISSPDEVPGYYSMQVQAYANWKHYKKVAELAEKHEQAAGIDPFVLEFRCESLEQLSRLDEAAPSLKSWLRWDPENGEALHYVARALPDDRKQWLIEHLKRVSDPAETAASMIEQFAYRDEQMLIRKLLQFVGRKQPHSPRVDYLGGLVEEAEGNYEAAADRFLQAVLTEQDKERKETYLWEYVGTMSELGKINEAYQALDDRREAFRFLAEWIDVEEDGSAEARRQLRNLVDAHRAHHPDDPQAHYYAGVLHALENRNEQADRDFQQAAESDDEDLRSMANSRRVGVLLELGRGLEAYESIGPDETTFRRIASSYEYREKPEELRELIELHKTKFPEDAWLNYYTGVACLLENDVEQAEQIFQHERRTSGDETVKSYCFSGLLNSRYESQGADSAYRKLDSSETAFQQLANRLSVDEKWDELSSLIDVHSRNHPDDLNLISQKIDLLWRDKDYTAIVREFAGTPALKKADRNSWQVRRIEDRNFRSFLRLNRFADALNSADTRFQQDGDPEQLLIVHLAAGNLDKAQEAFDLYAQTSYSFSSLYRDEDIGERLWSEKYRKLREQFPPPLPYSPLSDLAVLFLAEVNLFDGERISESVRACFGDSATMTSLEGTEEWPAYLIRSGDLRFVLTLGDTRYTATPGALDAAKDLEDPQLQTILEDHRAWLSLEVVTGRRYEPTDDERLFGYKLVSRLLDEQCTGVYLANEERIVANSPKLNETLTANSPETQLKELGKEIWLYRELPDNREETLATRRCQARFYRFVRAFSDRSPDREFLVQVRLFDDQVEEHHWIAVDEIKKSAQGPFRICGRFQSDSQLFPELKAGERVSFDKYGVYDWKYPDGSEIVRGRTASTE